MLLATDDLPFFFLDHHHRLAADLKNLSAGMESLHDPATVAAAMGRLGLYAWLMRQPADLRALCLIREWLGQINPLADSIFAVQGLSAQPLLLTNGHPSLDALARGDRIGAFALTEPEAGSDVSALRTTARRDDSNGGWILDGDKTLISNVGIAHQIVIFANADPAAGRKGICAFLVPADAPGLTVEAIPMTLDHPLGKIHLRGCRLPADALIGAPGDGLRLALATLGTFRTSVAAAACGMARRALDEAVSYVKRRHQGGGPLSQKPTVQATLAGMATELEAARLLTFRAAWEKDRGGRAAIEVAMAKLHATEAAFLIIDQAVQLHGGLGVTLGTPVERLLREIRPLRIYEGTSEVQRGIIGGMLVG